MMKIYTRTGDDGTTGLLGPERVQKDSLRIEAFGALDECNATIGIARSGITGNDDLDRVLGDLQSLLFSAGADLACPIEAAKVERVKEEDIRELENCIDRFELELPPLQVFILPGGTTTAANLQQARSICRRAERNIVRLSHREWINPLVLVAVNRLSDLLFVMGRVSNARSGVQDTPWDKKRWKNS